MHQPPAASFSFDRDSVPWGFPVFVRFVGGAVGSVFGAGQPEIWTWVVLAVAFGVVLLSVVRAWRNAPVGQLVWDGATWSCSAWPDEAIKKAFIAVDLQSSVLVGVVMGGRLTTRWVWLAGFSDARRWHGMRCALVASSQ